MKYTALSFALVLQLFFFCAPAFGATTLNATISGEVRAEDSGELLPGAHVFLAGTSYGDVTTAQGQFEISDIPAGSYRLIVTMLGFSSTQMSVEVGSDQAISLLVELDEAVYDLDTITVEGRRLSFRERRQRRLRMERFKRLFLGNTSNRKACDLANPEVLQFSDQGGVFKVKASAPLVIENRALGYRITYQLNDFNASGGSYRYFGEPFFEELKPGNGRDAKRWNRQREKTFNGSLNHYLRSLADGNTKEEGFKSFLFTELHWNESYRNLTSLIREHEAEVSMDTLILQGAALHEWRFLFHGYLHVLYTEDVMPREYYRDMGINRSRVEPYSAALGLINTSAGFNKIGFLNDPYAVSRYGYWNWGSGVCNILPFNYGL